MRKKIASIISLLPLAVSMGIIFIFSSQDVASANIVSTPIYASEDTTMIYEGVNAELVYEDGNLGYLDVGYQGTFGNPVEVQVLLKFDLPPTPPGYEVGTANLYIPVTGGAFHASTNFSLKVSTSIDHSWVQDSNITSPPAPTSGSTQTRLLANNVPLLKPTLAPFDFTSYISAESTKANPRVTFILSGMTAQEAAQAGIQYSDHYIQMTENHAYDGSLGPYLIITYSKIANIEITGVVDGGLYNTNVTPQFNVGTATLNGNPFTSGTQVTAEGSYTLNVTAGSQTKKIQFRIVKTPPTGTVIVNQGNQYTNNTGVSVSITPAPGVNDITHIRYSVNGHPFTQMPYVPSFMLAIGATNGDKILSFKLVDGTGNESPEYQRIVTLDTVVPTGSVVINNGNAYTTNRDVTLNLTLDSGVTDVVGIQFSDNNSNWSGVEAFSSTKSYTVPARDGNKTVYVRLIDRAGNSIVIQDSIILDTTAPIVSGVVNGASYNTKRTITFNEGTATLNGHPFVSGTSVDTEGSYTLVVKDAVGNTTTVSFIIDTTAPIVSGVVNGASYNTKRTITFNEGTATLNGHPFVSGTSVDTEGSYTLIVTDVAANSITITFSIVKTAPIKYTVKYDGNGATGGQSPVDSQTYENGHSVTVADNTGNLARTGFTFNGWNTKADGSGINYVVNTKFTIDASDVTLYALWKVNRYTLSFESNGGSVVATQNIFYNGTTTEPTAPTKIGYTFGGWFKEATFINSWNFTQNTVTGNTTLYAKWFENGTSGGDGGYIPTPEQGSNPKPTPEIPVKPEIPTEPEVPVQPIPTITFSDISTHWAKEMIEDMAPRGIINGYPDGTFRPNDSIQRQHVAILFTRALELVPRREKTTFNDVEPSHPYYEAIMKLQQAGIIDGSNGSFHPSDSLTRAQMAKIIALAFGLTSQGPSQFEDVPTTHWAYDYIATLEDYGIALGDDGSFKPNEPVTRAQFVAFLYRALHL
ncbi:S-layer homology domain-containing protein [Lysinibacillus cavernae]|uniref:S-layer homology domain-containing protein n=1 Tax=Lysinibacillus cavernae TaxID=2666135 RepID=UPI0018C345A0|nr:S-layer homology domain-containing protein [Lysinibacillus cavernae]